MNSSFQYTGNLAIDNFNLNNFNFISSDQCSGRISRHEVWRTFLRLGEGVNSNIKSSKISTEIRGEDKTRFSPFIPPLPQTQIWFWKPTYHCFDQIGFVRYTCYLLQNQCMHICYRKQMCIQEIYYPTMCLPTDLGDILYTPQNIDIWFHS